jgi:hypothetical protein
MEITTLYETTFNTFAVRIHLIPVLYALFIPFVISSSVTIREEGNHFLHLGIWPNLQVAF